MEIELLGPVRVFVDGLQVAPGRRQLRLLLALLAVHAGEVVSIARITDALWDVEPPREFQNQIQVLVRMLRRLATDGGRPDDPVETCRREGYRLRTPPAVVDLQRFGNGLEAADGFVAADRLEKADTVLTEALRLWRGHALQGLGGRFAESQSALLEERRLAAMQRHIDIRLALRQRPDLVVPDIIELVQEHPLHEGFRGRLMVALYSSDRASDSLVSYREWRQLLGTQHGTQPGERLDVIQRMILRGEPVSQVVAQLTGIPIAAKVSVPPRSETAADLPRPRQLPADLPAFTGRVTKLNQLDALLAERDQAGGMAVPVITIVGTPGVGKTTLAVRWSHRIAHRFPGGQLYLNLRGYDAAPPMEPIQALLTCLRALGVT